MKLMSVKCMYCTKVVKITNKNLVKPHKTYGDQMCIGSNFSATAMQCHIDLMKKNK